MGLWWSQLCAVLHQGREVAGLTRQGGLVGWREKPHIFLKHCSFLPQGLTSSSLLFRWVKQETEISKESQEADTRPKLDLGFKEGQTIKLNIGVSRPVYPASFSGYADGNSSLRFLFFFYTEHDVKERRSSQAPCVWIRGPKPAATPTRRQNSSPSYTSPFFHSHCQPCHTTTCAEIQ